MGFQKFMSDPDFSADLERAKEFSREGCSKDPTEFIRSRTPSRLRELIEALPDDARIRQPLLTRLNLLLSDIAAETSAANILAQGKVVSLTKAQFWFTGALIVIAAAQVVLAFLQLKEAKLSNSHNSTQQSSPAKS